MKSNLCWGVSSDFCSFTTKPSVHIRESRFAVCFSHSVFKMALISQSSRYWCRLMSSFNAKSFTSFTSEVKTRGAVASLKGRLLN